MMRQVGWPFLALDPRSVGRTELGRSAAVLLLVALERSQRLLLRADGTVKRILQFGGVGRCALAKCLVLVFTCVGQF
jgi:hypothetical protein